MIPMLVRTFIASVAGIASAAVPGAASRLVLDEVVGDGYFHSAAAFVTDDQTERAWVEAAVHNGGVGDDYRLRAISRSSRERGRTAGGDSRFPFGGPRPRSLSD